jgi:AbrB family looped-hinge helix DNA binding protein
MLKAKLTSKGQVTIPTALRRQLNLEAGDELLFVMERGEVRLRVLKQRRLSEFYGILPATRPYPSKDVIRQQVAEHLADQILNEDA